MKTVLALVFLAAGIASAQAATPTWVLVCSGAPCIAQDGTAQPIGTVVARITYDGHSTYTPPPNTALAADTGQIVYAPAFVAPASIPGYVFAQRFTDAERAAIMGNTTAAGKWLWIVASPAISNTDPIIVGDMTAAVTAGLLTAPRATTIMNFGTSSP